MHVKQAMVKALKEDATKAEWVVQPWLDWFNEDQVIPNSTFITYRTMSAVFQNPIKVEQIGARIKASMPIHHEMLNQYGEVDGQAGGVDISNPATQAIIDTLVGPADTDITVEQADAIKVLGSKTVPRWSLYCNKQPTFIQIQHTILKAKIIAGVE